MNIPKRYEEMAEKYAFKEQPPEPDFDCYYECHQGFLAGVAAVLEALEKTRENDPKNVGFAEPFIEVGRESVRRELLDESKDTGKNGK